MTVATQTQKIQKFAAFEIKSSQLSLLVFRLRSSDLELVTSEMNMQFADSPDFFDSEPVLIDVSELFRENQPPFDGNAESGAYFRFDSVIELLSRYRLKAVGVRGAPSSLHDSIRAAGLFLDDGVGDSTASAPLHSEPMAEAATVSPAVEKIDIESFAMVIDKPLRSGQQVYARGRDLVVLSMVNPGAEVIADGHIHVYAPLRGKAMAGASGDIRARIFAAGLEAELLSIAGVWQTSEALQKDPAWGGSAQVRLVLDEAAPAGSDQPTQSSASRARLLISKLGD